MICRGCGRQSRDWFGDPWCDECGGVMARPGFLIFRHVSTVDGKGGRLPIVWDESSSDYVFRYPKKLNPSEKLKENIDTFDFIRRIPPFLATGGSLDAVLAIALPLVKGDGDSVEISAAPTSTLEERALLGV